MNGKSTFAVAGVAVLLGLGWASAEAPLAQGVQGLTSRVTVVNPANQPVPIALPPGPVPVAAATPLPVMASIDLPVSVSGTTLVREVGNPALGFVRWSGDFPLEKDLQRIDEPVVPAVPLGKRLVVEHFTIRADGPIVSGVEAEATIRIPGSRDPRHGRVPIDITNQTLRRNNGEDLHFLTGSEEMTLYVDQAEGVQLEINFGPEPTGGGRLYWTLIGHLVDL